MSLLPGRPEARFAQETPVPFWSSPLCLTVGHPTRSSAMQHECQIESMNSNHWGREHLVGIALC